MDSAARRLGRHVRLSGHGRLIQEAPGMVGDTIAGTRVGVRHTRRRYAATLAALIAASAMVAGCTTSTAGPGVTTTATSGSSTATTTPTATATSTPSATTAPTAAYPADVPAEARANTPAGAIAFAKHFFGLVNRAYTTPKRACLPHFRRPTARRAQRSRAPQPTSLHSLNVTIGLPSRSWRWPSIAIRHRPE